MLYSSGTNTKRSYTIIVARQSKHLDSPHCAEADEASKAQEAQRAIIWGLPKIKAPLYPVTRGCDHLGCRRETPDYWTRSYHPPWHTPRPPLLFKMRHSIFRGNLFHSTSRRGVIRYASMPLFVLIVLSGFYHADCLGPVCTFKAHVS